MKQSMDFSHAIPLAGNKRSGRLSFVYLIILALTGCTGNPSPDTGPVPAAHSLTPAGVTATDPCFTVDHHGNPVLCWTEQMSGSETYLLKYAVFDPSAGAFGPAVSVNASAGTKTTAESANKIAFKTDGSIVALFGRRFDDPANRFAGAIQYSISTDEGQTWSVPQYLHSDTLHQYSRSFFDMATLANGEVAAVWLDGRYAGTDTGSALFFACTEPGGGFGTDKMIAEGTCECCRTDLLVDTAGTLHIAYRDILYPSSLFGKQVRDMAYIRSQDNGRTFSPPARISADNWEIDGCPHSGPSLAVTPAGVEAVWFTAGPGAVGGPGSNPGAPENREHVPAVRARTVPIPGIYRAVLPLAGKTPEEQAACIAAAPSRAMMNGNRGFSTRELIDSSGRHPQLISLPGGGTALVTGRPAGSIAHGQSAGTIRQAESPHHGSGSSAAPTQNHAGHSQERMGPHAGHGGTGTSSPSVIVMRLDMPGKEPAIIRLTDGMRNAHHPVLAVPEPGKLLVAWVEEERGTPGIRYGLTRW